MTAKPQLSSSVLDVLEHDRLIADLDHIVQTAGIQTRFVRESMTKYCGEEEVSWVRQFNSYRAAGTPGLLLEGLDHPDTRCQAIVGALVRNFIDARVVPLNVLLTSETVLNPTVLCIPNLFVNMIGKTLPAWRVQAVYDILLSRATHNRPTVAYVQSFAEVSKGYGEPFADFLSSFKIVKKG